jgi:hypothetical protein
MKDKNDRIKYLKGLIKKLDYMKNTVENETKIFLIELIQYDMNSRIIALNNVDDNSINDILDDILDDNMNENIEEEGEESIIIEENDEPTEVDDEESVIIENDLQDDERVSEDELLEGEGFSEDEDDLLEGEPAEFSNKHVYVEFEDGHSLYRALLKCENGNKCDILAFFTSFSDNGKRDLIQGNDIQGSDIQTTIQSESKPEYIKDNINEIINNASLRFKYTAVNGKWFVNDLKFISNKHLNVELDDEYENKY